MSVSRYRNRLVERGARSGRTLAICWGQWQVDGAVEAAQLPRRLERIRRLGMELIDPASALEVMSVSLRNRPEVAGFMAVHDRNQAAALLGLDAPSSAEAAIYARIEAFASGTLAKQDFIRFLDSVSVDACSESCQERIIEAIRRADRAEVAGSLPGVQGPASESRPQSERATKLDIHMPERSRASAKHATQETSPAQVVNISAHIINNVAKVLGLDREAIEVDRSFQEYGLDSISAAQLSAALEKQFKLAVPPNLLVECATINALSDRMQRAMAG